MSKIESLKITFLSIFRTRRRAFALISGIMLATMILSGIVLYSSVLQQRNFESIVGNTAYEISFNNFNNEQFGELSQLGSQIVTDDRVDAYAPIGGRQSTSAVNSFTDSSEYKISIQSVANATYISQSTRSGFTFRPLYVDQQFFTSEIGQSITEIFYEGEFRLPELNETIIPRSVATEFDLSVGEIINRANVSVENEVAGDTIFGAASATDIEVIGIYDQPPFEPFGFGAVAALDYPNVIFNQDLLETSAFSSYNEAMIQDGHFQLLLSIDETEFTVSEPDTFIAEINRLMNEISEEYGEDDLVGSNLIESALTQFTIFSIIVSVMYVIISIPVIILSLYVLNYGLTVSLEERKREIAIKKVQGASASQIFKEIRNESLLIFAFGIFFGYILATLVAFIIGNAVGFFEIEFTSFSDYLDYIEFNTFAIGLSTVIVGVMLIFVVYRKGKKFIEEEVSTAISRKQEVEYGFLRSSNLDLVFFGIGLIGFAISFAQQILQIEIQSGIAIVLIQLFTPFLIWIGGAIVGSRIVKIVPQFLEPIYLRLFLFKDISRMIKAGLRRRGDVNKLAIVIVLSLAVASMSVIQGVTDEVQAQNNVEYQVGSDFKITTSGLTNISSSLEQVNGVQSVQSIPTVTGRALSSTIRLSGLDPSLELDHLQVGDPIMEWESTTFEDFTAEEALQELNDNPDGVFITPGLQNALEKGRGDVFTMSFPLLVPNLNSSEVAIRDVEILGIINIMPGQLAGYALTSDDFIKEIYLEITQVPEALRTDQFLNLFETPSSQYQIDMVEEELTTSQISSLKEDFLAIQSVAIVSSLQEELNNLESSGSGFGITGLLTLSAAVSLLATFVASFAFSSIIMERRKREFAVIRAIGAKKSQIYKLAMGENFLMMLIGIIWGVLIGVAVAVIFNGFFAAVSGELLRQLTVPRQIQFPWLDLVIFSLITLVGMMIATMLSIRQSVNADLTQATRAE